MAKQSKQNLTATFFQALLPITAKLQSSILKPGRQISATSITIVYFSKHFAPSEHMASDPIHLMIGGSRGQTLSKTP